MGVLDGKYFKSELYGSIVKFYKIEDGRILYLNPEVRHGDPWQASHTNSRNQIRSVAGEHIEDKIVMHINDGQMSPAGTSYIVTDSLLGGAVPVMVTKSGKVMFYAATVVGYGSFEWLDIKALPEGMAFSLMSPTRTVKYSKVSEADLGNVIRNS
ncbi:hypothetical protein [Vibrio phage vB_VpaP_SJSY21]|nr:hypothetical protein [Vibrio phage vB_VpaP_SJSY21]